MADETPTDSESFPGMQKKKGLTWIHLSDWHQEGKKFDRKVVGDALVADIEKRKNISPDLAKIDFIVFSGDVANAGRPSEYEDAIRELFQPLLAASDVSHERLFIIPGNHDLDRGLIPVGLSKPLKSHDQVETLWNDDEKRNQLFLPFQAFYRFLKDYTGHIQPKYANTCEFEICGKKIALLGINSAWMCARNKEKGGRFNDQGCLCIGEQQIYEPLKQITNADIKIAILHHPFDWLAPFDQGRVEVHLKRKCNIILHGHGHKPGVLEINDNFGYYVVIPAGACYDRRSTADLDYTFSYNFVHLDLDTNRGTAFLRRWSDQNREWRKDDDTCPEGKRDFSILRKEKVQIPHQIPNPPQDFTGRDDDLKELLDHFEQGATITGLRGMGGIGKTALAYKLAEKLADRYPDGQILVDMKGTSDEPMTPTGAMAKVIHAFDPEVRTQENESELAGLYRSKLYGKQVLILMDNAIDDNQVRPLLPPASCGLIVTSREKFTLPGLKEKNLNIMNSPDACALLLKIADRIGDHADKLASLCGYLPLALRAAGSLLANTNDLSPAEYAKQLHAERTRLERIGRVGVDLDVEASFNLSYRRLKPEMARIFRLLSIFPADFDASAEEFICKDRAHKNLSMLVRWSLVDFHAGNGRYLLHDLTRIFATKCFNEEDDIITYSKAMERYALRYLNVLTKAEGLYLKGKENILLGLGIFDRELTNILVGHAWAEKNAKVNNKAAAFCDSYSGIGSLHALRLHPRSWIRWLEPSISAAQKLKKRRSECIHLSNLGNAYSDLGETHKAIEYYKQALEIFREIGDRQGEGVNLGNLGSAYSNLGETRKSIEYYEQALVISREVEDRRNEGTWLGNLGNAYLNLGEKCKAIEHQEQALEIFREIGDRRGEGSSLCNLGNMYSDLSETHRAIEYYEQALVIDKEIGYKRGEGIDLGNLGSAKYELGEIRKAIEYYEQALVIDREIGYKRGEGINLGEIGLAYVQLGKTQRAIDCCEQGLAIHREIEYRKGEGENLGKLGLIYAYLGETQRAIDCCEQGLAIHREMGDRSNEGKTLSKMSDALYLLGKRTQAIELAEKALGVYEVIKSPKAENVRKKLAEWKEKRQAN